MASRRNYDVGQDLDAHGQMALRRFEASWRSGGASTAELAGWLNMVAATSLLPILLSTSEASILRTAHSFGTPSRHKH
jgi:hypothetical protein